MFCAMRTSKGILIAVIVGAILLGGCAAPEYYDEPVEPVAPVEPVTPVAPVEPVEPVEPTSGDNGLGPGPVEAAEDDTEELLEYAREGIILQDLSKAPYDECWFAPAWFDAGGVFPGAIMSTYTADIPELNVRAGDPICVIVHNGFDHECPFSITFKIPDRGRGGYEVCPPEVENWVKISEELVMLGPKETRNIPVVIRIPKSAKDLPDRWEFHINCKDMSQTGFAQYDHNLRFRIVMR